MISIDSGPGDIYVQAANAAEVEQAFPIAVTPDVHKGKLQIWNAESRLVYSWQSLNRLLANTRYAGPGGELIDDMS